MKRLALYFVVIFLVSSYVFASDIDRHFTQTEIQDQLNGRAWNELDDGEKLFYVIGLREGMWLGKELYVAFEGYEQEKIKEILEQGLATFHIKATNEEVKEYFNKFYSEVANLNIPVTEVYWIMYFEYTGFTEEETNKLIYKLRKEYN